VEPVSHWWINFLATNHIFRNVRVNFLCIRCFSKKCNFRCGQRLSQPDMDHYIQSEWRELRECESQQNSRIASTISLCSSSSGTLLGLRQGSSLRAVLAQQPKPHAYDPPFRKSQGESRPRRSPYRLWRTCRTRPLTTLLAAHREVGAFPPGLPTGRWRSYLAAERLSSVCFAHIRRATHGALYIPRSGCSPSREHVWFPAASSVSIVYLAPCRDDGGLSGSAIDVGRLCIAPAAALVAGRAGQVRPHTAVPQV